jgi:hypothetical protein
MHLLTHTHHLAVALNPLIGPTIKDTIENITLCLEHLGRMYSDTHADPSIGFTTAAAVAALKYEVERIAQSE